MIKNNKQKIEDENLRKAIKEIEINYKNNVKEFVDTYYYSNLKSKINVDIGLIFFNELKNIINFKDKVNEAETVCDSNGCYKLVLSGKDFRFVLSGCNSGYRGPRSDYTIHVLKECGFDEVCNCKKYVEREHYIKLKR